MENGGVRELRQGVRESDRYIEIYIRIKFKWYFKDD